MRREWRQARGEYIDRESKKEAVTMLATAFMLLVSGTFLMLRLGNNTGSFPKPLGQKEETELVERWLAGDMEARNRLIEHNLRLVTHIMKKYYTQTSDQDDLISIGTIGLIKGVSTYRPDKGVRLATYASRCIENEILMHFRGKRKSASDISLEDSLDMDGEGNGLSLLDVLCQEDDMLERISARETAETLGRLVEQVLTPREAKVIRLRYGLQGKSPMPQREVAAACGISRSYVSRRPYGKRYWAGGRAGAEDSVREGTNCPRVSYFCRWNL